MMIDVFFGVVLTLTYSSDAYAVNQDGFQPCQQYLAQFQFYSQKFSNKVRSQQLQLNSLNSKMNNTGLTSFYMATSESYVTTFKNFAKQRRIFC